MPDFSNSIIYKIVCNITAEVYIGSSTLGLKKRMGLHISLCKSWQAGKANYCASYGIIERGDYTEQQIEPFPCPTRQELIIREGYYIKKYRDACGAKCVNKNMAGSVGKNRMIREREKERRLVNRLKNKEISKEKRRACSRKWKEDNRERNKAWNKKYHQNNKERLQRPPYTCPNCNKTMNNGSKYKHAKRCKKTPANQTSATQAASPTFNK